MARNDMLSVPADPKPLLSSAEAGCGEESEGTSSDPTSLHKHSEVNCDCSKDKLKPI